MSETITKPKTRKAKVHRRTKKGSGLAYVTPTQAAVMSGEDDLSDWSIEELINGKRKGQPGDKPSVVAYDVHRELAQRMMLNGMHRFAAELEYTIQKHIEIVKAIDPTDPTPVQLRALLEIENRLLGMPKERVDVTIRGTPRWEKAVADSIVANAEQLAEYEAKKEAGEIIDAEIVDEDEEEAR